MWYFLWNITWSKSSMEPEYLTDLMQKEVIGVNFFMGAYSLLMGHHRCRAGHQCQWTSCYSLKRLFYMLLETVNHLRSSSARLHKLSKCCNSIFNPALCYCTAGLLSSRWRPPSVVCSPSPAKPVFFSELVKQINAKFGGKVPFHYISRPFFFCFCFSKYCIFDFLWLFFRFVNMGPYGRKHFKRHLLWKYVTDSFPKIHAYF